MKKIIKINENQLTNLVKRIIKEVGGYDDKNIMGQHVRHTMSILTTSYSELTNTMTGLVNSVSRGDSKMDIIENLIEFSTTIKEFIDILTLSIGDFTEDELIRQAKLFKKQLNTTITKIDILTKNPDAMGNDDEFSNRVMDLLKTVVPSIRDYSEKLSLVNDRFTDRLSGGWVGFNS